MISELNHATLTRMPYKDTAQQREAQRVYAANRRASDPEGMKAYVRQRRASLTAYVANAKDVPCADCGMRYPPYVMDFDHLRDKTAAISWFVTGNYSIKRVQEEIDKCDVVCANCHRERTHQRGEDDL